MKVSVVGLGRLGAPLAAVIAARGHQVIGVDRSRLVVDAVNSGEAPVQETGLQALLDEITTLSATESYPDAVRQSDLTLVLVPTPSLSSDRFSNEFVLDAVTRIGQIARRKPSRHVVVVCSTVMPGSCDGPIREALEEASGLVVGDKIGLCYSPEFIALGSVIDNIHRPDMILIGESDSQSGSLVEQLLLSITFGEPPVCRMNLINAEIAKISLNAYVTQKISTANLLAEVCERLPNADARVVVDAIGHDRRVGRAYLTPGTAFGGPCFPRDARAWDAMAADVGVSADLMWATEKINRRQVDRLVELVLESRPSKVGVIGVAFKPDTPVWEESAGWLLVNELRRAGVELLVFDKHARPEWGFPVLMCDSAQQCADLADVAVIMVPDRDYIVTGRRVIDCWGLVDQDGPQEVLTIGRSNQRSVSRGVA